MLSGHCAPPPHSTIWQSVARFLFAAMFIRRPAIVHSAKTPSTLTPVLSDPRLLTNPNQSGGSLVSPSPEVFNAGEIAEIIDFTKGFVA
jgi:hypothetical protein